MPAIIGGMDQQDWQAAKADMLDDRARMADLERRWELRRAVQRLADDGYEPPAAGGKDPYRYRATISRSALWPVQKRSPRR